MMNFSMEHQRLCCLLRMTFEEDYEESSSPLDQGSLIPTWSLCGRNALRQQSRRAGCITGAVYTDYCNDARELLRPVELVAWKPWNARARCRHADHTAIAERASVEMQMINHHWNHHLLFIEVHYKSVNYSIISLFVVGIFRPPR